MSEETILITGVSSGLGHGLAEIALQRGATVYGCSRRQPADLLAQGLHWTAIDLRDEPNGRALFRDFLPAKSAWSAVFLNAGKLGTIRDLADCPTEDLRETMEINVWANHWILQTLFAHAASVRQVVAISSGASVSGSRGWNGYSISKAALNMLVRLYAGEQPDTHFTALAPGLVDSEMQDYLTSLPPDDRFPPLEILREAKGTPRMPDGPTAAARLLDLLPQLLSTPSGSYQDVRHL
jgi:NAD(P)-dependent dehydrogenase (short-subunit alcohol dehydrogenase family)